MKKIMLVLLLLIFTYASDAEKKNMTNVADEHEFNVLRKEREKIRSDIQQLELKIQKLKEEIENYDDLRIIENRIFEFNQRLSLLPKKAPTYKIDSAATMNFIRNEETARNKVIQLNTELLNGNGMLQLLYNSLWQKEENLNELLMIEIDRQQFMQIVSVIFSLLVALLIVGFFFMTKLDSRIRQNIFSSDSGIQFLTLFSIVIAIILFGITGVLEGEELSALLGAIAGYILGKAKSNGETVEAAKEEDDYQTE